MRGVLYEHNTEFMFYKIPLDEGIVTLGKMEGFPYMTNRSPVATASGYPGLTRHLGYQ